MLKNLLKILKARRMTQKELAEKTVISRATIANYVAGKGVPRLDHACRIAEVLSCELTDLLDTPKQSTTDLADWVELLGDEVSLEFVPKRYLGLASHARKLFSEATDKQLSSFIRGLGPLVDEEDIEPNQSELNLIRLFRKLTSKQRRAFVDIVTAGSITAMLTPQAESGEKQDEDDDTSEAPDEDEE